MIQILNQYRSKVKLDLIGWLFILLGIVLRLRQYFVNRSLWADEASLALNLVSRNFGELTQKLDYEQGAPIIFLFIEKFFIILLGNKDYIMRLFPLLAGILAVYLFYRITREYFGKAGLFALFIFVTSSPLIYYSSELKQYSSDVTVALLLVFLAMNCSKEKTTTKDFLPLGVAGMIAIWVSHAALFILASIGLALFVEKIIRKDRTSVFWLLGWGIAWVASFGLEYIVSLQNLIADDFLQGYWAKAFAPLPPWSNLSWYVKTAYSLLYITLYRTDFILAVVFIILCSIGGLAVFFRNRTLAIMLVFLFVWAWIASALDRYPLKDRFMLFLVPFLLLLFTEGLMWIYRIASRWNRGLGFILAGIPALIVLSISIPSSWYFVTHPIDTNIRPVMKYVGSERAPDDIVYVYHSAEPSFRYYAPFYSLETGDIRIGFDTTRKKIALNGFFDDIDKLRGNPRVWFIFTDIVDCGDCKGDMQAFYVSYLDGRGTMIDSIQSSGANAYLYDMRP